MGQIGTTLIDANRSMLRTLGRKMLAGSKLSLSENLMALCICGGNSRFLWPRARHHGGKNAGTAGKRYGHAGRIR